MDSNIVAKVDLDRGLTEFHVSGLPTSEDLANALREHYQKSPTPLALWDLTEASLSSLDPAGFFEMTSVANSFAESRGGSPRTVIIVKEGVEGILGRLYKDVSVANQSTVTYHVVTTRRDAIAWLTGSV